MIDLEDEKERILEQLAAMVADASVKPELRLKAAGMVLGHERGKAAPAKHAAAARAGPCGASSCCSRCATRG